MKSICHALTCATLLATVLPAFAQDTEEEAPPEQPSLILNDQTDEERIEFLLQVANAYFQVDDFESAIDAYHRILEIDPEQKQAAFIVAHVYIDARQYENAEKALLRLIERYPEDFQLKNNLAWLYATADDPAYRNGAKAVELAQEAMVLAPNDHHVWSTLSEAYYVTGEYEKAHRAILQMAALATRYGTDITKEMVDEYNRQIRKCQRAMDTQKALTGEDEKDSESDQ